MKFIDIIFFLIGYLVGSLPWALIIGRVFYQTDIREHGSGNLGGTNAARTLGNTVGITVIILDAIKALIIVLLINLLSYYGAALAGLGAVIGHCYPIFADFRGGKGVATTFGYLLAISIISGNYLLFILPIVIFFVTLLLTKIVSFSSLLAFSCAMFYSIFTSDILISITVTLAILLVIYRHRSNVCRIRSGTERKIGRKK